MSIINQQRGTNALLFDRMRLAHLRAKTSIKTKTKKPRPFSIVNLPVTRTAVSRILRRNSGFPVQIQVRCHPAISKKNDVIMRNGDFSEQKLMMNLIAIPRRSQVLSCSYRSTAPQPHKARRRYACTISTDLYPAAGTLNASFLASSCSRLWSSGRAV